MNLIGIVGIFGLLGIAWLISYDKKNIPFKVIFWGIGLQFLFAIIILREDNLSFLGMGILASLILYYQYSNFSKNKKIKTTYIITPILLITGIVYCIKYNYTGRFIFENF